MESTKTPEYPYNHSVIVLTYTRADLIEARIAEITRLYASRPDIEFIVLDNGSTNMHVRLALAATGPSVQEKFRYQVERIEPNVGFGGGWNEAVSRSSGRIVHLLSDDVQVLGDFVSKINSYAPQLVESDKWIAGQMMVQEGGWNQFNGFTIPYLMGYYLAMPRAIWDAIGGFDFETFYPYDFEDVDLCHRAGQIGAHLISISDLPLRHEVAGTIGYNPNRFEHTVKMRAAFAKKWGLPNIPERP